MQDDIERVLIDRGAIADRIQALADEITQDLYGSVASLADPYTETDTPQPAGITLVPILTGSLIFVSRPDSPPTHPDAGSIDFDQFLPRRCDGKPGPEAPR